MTNITKQFPIFTEKDYFLINRFIIASKVHLKRSIYLCSQCFQFDLFEIWFTFSVLGKRTQSKAFCWLSGIKQIIFNQTNLKRQSNYTDQYVLYVLYVCTALHSKLMLIERLVDLKINFLCKSKFIWKLGINRQQRTKNFNRNL